MKKFLFISLLLNTVLLVNVHAENTDISALANVVYIEPFEAVAGSECTLSVKMKNTVEAESFGFDLVLPTGIAVATDEDGFPIATLSTERTNSKKTNHFDADFKLDGSLNVQAYSSNGSAISGSDGEVAQIVVKVASDLAQGTYPIFLKNIAIADVNSVTKRVESFETSISIVGVADLRTLLDENSSTAPESATNVNVRVKRGIDAAVWNTICLPFAMTEAQVKETFGSDVQVADFTGTESEFDGDKCVSVKANFNSVSAIEPNHPYIIKVSETVTEFALDGVDIVVDENKAYIEFDNGLKGTRRVVYSGFYGTYHAGTVLDVGTLYLCDNKFWYSSEETEMKAYRAYFYFLDKLTDYDETQGANVTIYIDGVPTGVTLKSIIDGGIANNYAIYNLSGQRMLHPRKGMNIIDGRKVIVR